jgi:DNA-binding NarL/FixJ family response regulator
MAGVLRTDGRDGERAWAARCAEAPLIAALAAEVPDAKRIERALGVAGLALYARVDEPGDVAMLAGDRPDALVAVLARGLTQRDREIRQLRRLLPAGRIVLVADSDSRRGVRRALEAGADGVVLDAHLDQALGPTVDAVLAGQVAVPAAGRNQVERPSLSVREQEAMALVVMGLSNKEIAARLFLAESTVKSHLSSIFTKLGVRSRAEAVELVLTAPSDVGLVSRSRFTPQDRA